MGNFMTNSKNPNLVKIRQKYSALHIETKVCHIVDCDINSP